MDEVVLNYPVIDISGEELLPADVRCTPLNLEMALCAMRPSDTRMVDFLKYGHTRADLMELLDSPPYDVVFGRKVLREQVLTILQEIELPVYLLQATEHFKEVDPHTYRHLLAIYALSIALVEELEPGNTRNEEAAAGPTHDLGKMSVPLEILQKKDPLTWAEKEQLDHHAIAGYVMVSCGFQDTMNHGALIARDHHERLDGSGYPRGIPQENPFIEAVAVADVYDALISPRSYRKDVYDNRTALEEITSMAEKGQISWRAVKALIAFNRANMPGYAEVDVSRERRGTPPADNNYGIYVDDAEAAEGDA